MVGRGPVHAAPDVVAEARRGGADIGMAVVPIHAPRAQHALHVAIVSRSPDVVHHLVAAVLTNGGAYFGGESVQRLVPRRALPLALAALARALQGIQYALWIVDLVDGGRAFGAVAPATARMVRVALKLLDSPALLVDIGQQPTGRLAVEADRGDDLVVPLHFARPRLRIVLHPIAPPFRGRTRGQVAHHHRLAARGDVLFQRDLGHLTLLFSSKMPWAIN